MRLFRRETAPQPAEAPVQEDFRTQPRRSVWGDLELYEAVIDGRRARIRNLSDGGAALAFDEMTAPVRGVMEIFRNGVSVRRAYAIRAWGRDETVGYKLVEDLKVASGTPEGVDEAALRAKGIRRRLATEVERFRPGAAADAAPQNEGLRGDTLRARLGL